MNRSIAIIPARGGSKRIPGKNIKLFLGKPIIAYPIEAALKSNLFDQVIVSTDDDEIADVAVKYGATVPFRRSEKTADDYATLSDVVEEVKENLSKDNTDYKDLCLILATAVLVDSNDLVDAHNTFAQGGFDTLRPVVKYSYPIQRAFKLVDGNVQFMNPELARTRSQDLEDAYHDSGSFYWIKKNSLLSSPKRGAIVIPPYKVQDIDEDNDWKMAELKYKMINGL